MESPEPVKRVIPPSMTWINNMPVPASTQYATALLTDLVFQITIQQK